MTWQRVIAGIAAPPRPADIIGREVDDSRWVGSGRERALAPAWVVGRSE
jgi:hypothetical protein